ncbi:Biotin/lipoyl attachment domain-containing protein isoform 2 [Hibiscus syriacus]|uniref:Biotin/lipoyl attachment domain-containing protein isoform 2 n=1 Tax=Hibiscus syriacus TaxID=106335 RepID=A0A6A2YKT3_HIBSY|nr:biotin carboxyl carrier protein of acetyl-CoA carboxylase-like isoform X2 [Hibiscus syriacus]KAE8679347.1 Biotin/lipoyl attachment domain-containing protein isoform 2 [Hibiscus syriacus]
MESSAALRSFHCAVSQAHCRIERSSTFHVSSIFWPNSRKSCVPCLTFGGNNNSSTRRIVTLTSSAKTSETTVTDKSNDSTSQGSSENKSSQNATLPNGFEALVLEVCDETEIAELKMKIGDFEMHLKRNVGATKAPMSNISPTTAPPIPTEPMNEAGATALAPSAPKPSPEKPTPFKNVAFGKSSKLAALEASGSSNYVLVPSPIVGTFRRGRTVKGKRQPHICKEGDLVKEGQLIGFLDQFGTELPVKSDIDGEVLKILFDDGDAVGYGDPLIAVLPSFHGIN